MEKTKKIEKNETKNCISVSKRAIFRILKLIPYGMRKCWKCAGYFREIRFVAIWSHGHTFPFYRHIACYDVFSQCWLTRSYLNKNLIKEIQVSFNNCRGDDIPWVWLSRNVVSLSLKKHLKMGREFSSGHFSLKFELFIISQVLVKEVSWIFHHCPENWLFGWGCERWN